LGPIPNPQSPIPNPQSPIPNKFIEILIIFFLIKNKNNKNKIINTKIIKNYE